MRRKGIGILTGILVLSCFFVFTYSGRLKSASTTVEKSSKLQQVKMTQSRLNILVDPRIELLSALQIHGGGDNMTMLDFEYKDRMYGQFLDHYSQPAVGAYEAMTSKGFSYDAPPATMLYYSYPLEMSRIKKLDPGLAQRAGGEKQLAGFMKHLNSYAKASGFSKFYSDNAAFYKKLVNSTASTVKDLDMVNRLEAYYGEKQNSYNIILAPMFIDGGYGPRVKAENGKYDIYGIIGPGNEKDGMPYYEKSSLRHLVLHEFGHSFVNPVTQKHSKEISKYAKLFDRLKSKMQAQAYGSWETCVNEHIVRAVVARITLAQQGEKAYQRIINSEKSNSFAYIETICKKLEIYENSRSKYKTFEAFYPELLKVFKELSSTNLTEDFYKYKFNGMINAAMAMGNPVVFIVPTKEDTRISQTAIYEYVKQIKGSFAQFKDAVIINDDEALSKDLGNDTIIAYGTMEGNLWLAKHKEEFPFQISKDKIIVESEQEYTQKGLRFITALPNPMNPYNAVVIYTAQEASNIPGINNVFHGPTDYVVAKGNEEIKAGDYNK